MQPEVPHEQTEAELHTRDTDLDAQLSDLVRNSRRYLWMTIAFLGVMVLALTGAVVWLVIVNNNNVARNEQEIVHNQQLSDHRWCSTMDLLTAKAVPPADPKTDPSRAATYELYVDFVRLKDEFGCG